MPWLWNLWLDRKAGPRAGLSRPGQPRRQPDASRPTVSAVPSTQLQWARAHETGSRPPRGRTPASDRWLNQVGHLHPAGRSTVHGAPPLSASQAGFGLPAGRPRTRPGPCQPLLRTYHGGRRLGWEPLGRSTDSAAYPGSPSGTSEPPGRTGLRRPSGAPGTAGASSSSESPTILRTLAICLRARMARTTSRPNGSYSMSRLTH